jgi:hypothetical protein
VGPTLVDDYFPQNNNNNNNYTYITVPPLPPFPKHTIGRERERERESIIVELGSSGIINFLSFHIFTKGNTIMKTTAARKLEVKGFSIDLL